MTDPLSLLRNFNVNKRDIVERDERIILGEFSWPRNSKTKYLTHTSRKEGAVKEYYTLESLIYLLKNIHLQHPIYVRKATAENIPVVRRPDRKDVLEYLMGIRSTSASIDKSAILVAPTKRSAEDEFSGPESKKRLFTE